MSYFQMRQRSIKWDQINQTITLNQTHYINTILAKHLPHEHLNGCDVPLIGQLSTKDSPSIAEEIAQMANIPYREVVRKLLYLSITTHPDIDCQLLYSSRLWDSNVGEPSTTPHLIIIYGI